MERGETARRSHARAKGDRSHDRERCRTLDIAARIVFGVSVMDRKIEDYLVDMGMRELGARKMGKRGERGELALNIRRMGFGARRARVIRHVTGKGAEVLFEEIRKVRSVRNTLAHSTMDVNADGTVMIKSAAGDEATGESREYNADMLAETLKKADWCNRRLREVLVIPSKTIDVEGGEL